MDRRDNASDVPPSFEKLRARGVQSVKSPQPFNASVLKNLAAKHSLGEVLVFVDERITVSSPQWLEEMVSQAMREGVGAVGPMIYDSSDKVRHAGIVLGMDGLAGPAMQGIPRGGDGYCNHLNLTKNYSAVSGECMAIRTKLFEQLGGFHDTEPCRDLHDVDLCLRALAAGYRNVWTPFAEVTYHDSAPGVSLPVSDEAEFYARLEKHETWIREKWGSLVDDDPAYNPNLTLSFSDFSLAWPPRPIAAARTQRFKSITSNT